MSTGSNSGSNNGRRQQQQRRRGSGGNGKAPKPTDIWRPAPPLGEPDLIRRSNDPTALLRSLGDPPLSGNSIVNSHYLLTVAERAAALATALAASADLVEDSGD